MTIPEYKPSEFLKHEIGFITTFVEESKRDRYLGFVGIEKNRSKFISRLDHPNFLVEKYRIDLISKMGHSDNIESELMNFTDVNTCYVISTNVDIDKKRLRIADALKETIGSGYGTVLSILPGKLVYFESENGDRAIFRNG